MFLFRLAMNLGMTVEQLSKTMSSEELSEWIALDLYHEPLPQPWQQTGVLASAVLAPHCGKAKRAEPKDFVPTKRLPQTQAEMLQQLQKLKSLKQQQKRS